MNVQKQGSSSIKIKFLYDKKPDKKKTFIKINKIRKQQSIKLKSILKIPNISESTYRRRVEKDKSFERNRKDTQNIKLIKKNLIIGEVNLDIDVLKK